MLDGDMEYTEVKAQTPVDIQLEPLVILEVGDEPEDFMHISTRGKFILRVTKPEDDMQEDGDRLKGRSTNGVEEGECAQVDLQIAKEEAEPQRKAEKGCEIKDQEDEGVVRMEERILEDLRSGPEVVIKEEARGTEVDELKIVSKEEPLADAQSTVQFRTKDLLKPDDDHQKVRRLSSDSPDALYELLCALQEGRRLNDQRCSFTLEPRRRCHSVPSARHPGHKVVFSSMTSLQKEEIMDLIAISQARRLDDQRANFKGPDPASLKEPRRPSSAPAEIPPSRHKSRRSSWKQVMDFGHSAPKPAAKEELYNMILTTQAQGRLEDQRSKAPGPMDDEDFFSLLMKVQGGRMEEQRTELPLALQY